MHKSFCAIIDWGTSFLFGGSWDAIQLLKPAGELVSSTHRTPIILHVDIFADMSYFLSPILSHYAGDYFVELVRDAMIAILLFRWAQSHRSSIALSYSGRYDYLDFSG